MKILEKYFALGEHSTNIRKEILAGITTFLTMAYIVFVQPAVLSTDFAGNPTGLDFGALLFATCLISAATSIFMGLYANYPIACAPGMGENFFFVSVIMALTTLGYENAWSVALGIVFVSGIIFLLLSVLRVREAIINAISPNMRNGIAVGIGLFITFIGFQHGNIITSKAGTMVGLNTDFLSHDILIFIFGLVFTGVLRALRVKGNILWGIFASSLLAFLLGEIEFKGIFGFPQIHQAAAFRMDIVSALSLTCIPFIIVFLFMDVFDTIGTLMGVSETAGFIKDNKIPRVHRVLIVDAAGTVGGACLGTSTVTSYIESVTGVAFGGRTGLVSVVVGLFFLLALFFGPLIGMIGKYPPITAPALVIVGSLMMSNVRKIDWDDHAESIPAFLIIMGIPLFFSIADGIALGFITYPVINLLSGRGKKVSILMYVISVLLLGYFVFIRAKLG